MSFEPILDARRWRLRASWLGAVAAVVLGASCASSGGPESASTEDASTSSPVVATSAPLQTARPNIVFILVDDLDQALYDRQGGLKSLLDQQGTRFDNHLVNVSLCCPSRIATLRGQFAHNSGIFTNSGSDGGFAKVYADGLENSTAATWLETSGYRTALVGKYLNGYPNGAPSNVYIPPGWTRWFSPNGGSPYSEYDYDLNQNGTTVHYGHTDADYGVDVVSNRAATFIENTSTTYPNKPFFLYLAPYVPHGPATPPTRYQDSYPNATAPRTASWNEADVSDKPAWLRAKAQLTSAQIASIDDLYRKRRQTLLAVEDLVRNVIDTLTATGQLNNTYIFFSSDNGFHQGHHRLTSGKNTAFDEDLVVPFVVRGPGVPAGRVVSELTGNVDLASTWAELAGVTTPSWVDGRSLVPFLRGQTPTTWRQAFLLEHGGPSLTLASADATLEPQDPFDQQALAAGSGGGAPVFVGIRTATRTYLEYDTGERELYENTLDPAQLDNAYATSSTSLRASLSQWVADLRGASGATLRAAERQQP